MRRVVGRSQARTIQLVRAATALAALKRVSSGLARTRSSSRALGTAATLAPGEGYLRNASTFALLLRFRSLDLAMAHALVLPPSPPTSPCRTRGPPWLTPTPCSGGSPASSCSGRATAPCCTTTPTGTTRFGLSWFGQLWQATGPFLEFLAVICNNKTKKTTMKHCSAASAKNEHAHPVLRKRRIFAPAPPAPDVAKVTTTVKTV